MFFTADGQKHYCNCLFCLILESNNSSVTVIFNLCHFESKISHFRFILHEFLSQYLEQKVSRISTLKFPEIITLEVFKNDKVLYA